MSEEKEKKGAGYYFDLKEVASYYFRKKDPNRPSNTNIKIMHGINKISIIMFLIALVVMISRFIIRAM